MTAGNSGFTPVYSIPPAIAQALMRIEAVRQQVELLPITPRVLANLRETARLFSTHYSTRIEGNLLTREQVAQVIVHGQHFPGRERDQAEVLGYYAALDECLSNPRAPFTETTIRRIHALVMAGGKATVKPTPYRDGQNVIQVSRTGAIVYLPPQAQDVPHLMGNLVRWVNAETDLPVPLIAAIAHYQFATVHPYYDGNGRTARLITTLLLHRGGFGLKGLCALEEYYARDLAAYYRALDMGPSHNYYLGRPEADITPWLAYFIEGMATSFEKVRDQSQREGDIRIQGPSPLLRTLDSKQKKSLTLFQGSREIASSQIADLFHIQQQSAARLCTQWTQSGFLVIANPSRKARLYRLADLWEDLFRDQ